MKEVDYNKKIVVIDDQGYSAIGVKGILNIGANYDVHIFTGHRAVKNAIEHYTENPGDIDSVGLFMVDLRINGSDNGMMFVKWLKDNGFNDKLWIIWTGCDSSETRYYSIGRKIDENFDNHVFIKDEFSGKDRLIKLVDGIVKNNIDTRKILDIIGV